MKELTMVDTKTLASELTNLGKEEDRAQFDIQPIPGEIEVLQIFVEGREELPVNLTVAGDEILCIVNLFKVNEVNKDMQDEMNSAMLAMNIPMPLSSFATIDDQYVVFGALSANSSVEDIAYEIETLSENSVEAIDALKEFLV